MSSNNKYPSLPDADTKSVYSCADNRVINNAPVIEGIVHQVKRVSEKASTVLIEGETGTGKEFLARQIHESGPRSFKPFIPVNCAALTPTLAESQLFGHEKGAFTGAAGSSLGMFRAADQGVLLLDEIGDMPLELQPKLLRVIQQREVTPVGSSASVPIDVQIIAATNRDLEAEVKKGTFREDLYYRLNMIEISVPSLRERVGEIPEFVRFFSKQFSLQYEQPEWEPDADTLSEFCDYHWPGNIRQLSHVIEQSYVLDCAPVVPNSKDAVGKSSALPFFNLSRLKSAALEQALASTRGHKGKAARLLGVHANTLTRMLAEHKEAGHEHNP